MKLGTELGMKLGRRPLQLRNKPYEGLFLTVEGGEGVGKSTLAEKLTAYLEKEGYSVVRTREPGGSTLAEKIRTFILDPKEHCGQKAELFLFLAARAQHVDDVILPALRAGKVVLCERFNDSTIAYQGCGRKLGMAYVEELCKLAFPQFDPDCTLFLDIEPAEGLKRAHAQRGGADRIEQEELQFHREVRQAFLQLADKHPERIAIIDAASPLDKVFQDAVTALKPHLMLKPLKK